MIRIRGRDESDDQSRGTDDVLTFSNIIIYLLLSKNDVKQQWHVIIFLTRQMSRFYKYGGILQALSLVFFLFTTKFQNGCCNNDHISGFAHHYLTSSTPTAARGWAGFRMSLPLYAKSKQNKRKGGRRGRLSNQIIQEDKAEPSSPSTLSRTGNNLRPPTKTKKCWIRLDRFNSSSPIDICLVEINDASWWEQENNINPYGARVWPPSLAVARFLAKYLDEKEDSNYHVVEVGCGTALIAMTAGACGATAIATDVSNIALSLAKQGWSETAQRLQQTGSMKGNFNVASFDLLSNNALPLPRVCWDSSKSASGGGEPSIQSTTPHCILVASAVLYEKTLAKAIAKRVMEACDKGAWVILADDDTGLREGGRVIFEAEWQELTEKHERSTGRRYRSQWTHETVKQKDVFGWTDKKVQLLHVNHPPLPNFE
jgi:predicted nicotinamide N-methyase